MSGPFQRLTQLPDPHLYDEDPKSKTCLHCPLPWNHQVHDETKVAQAQAERTGWVAEDARRLGEGKTADRDGA